ncbi:LysR family transcriptional regulator [Olsenella uli]|nr:LysR family transcriptional regulator [Olsenella uli]
MLEYFLPLAREGSVSGAAEALLDRMRKTYEGGAGE